MADMKKVYNNLIIITLYVIIFRFVSSEMAFFSRWWKDQNVSMQQKVRQLVHQGRLQFVGGGWTQNDEAVTHYSAILDNLSLGMKFIADNFGNFEHFL